MAVQLRDVELLEQFAIAEVREFPGCIDRDGDGGDERRKLLNDIDRALDGDEALALLVKDEAERVGAGNLQQMMRITKLEDGTLKEELFDNFSFVPMLTGRNG